jgi:hypothetical protein
VVQLLDPAPREVGEKGVFVAGYVRFDLGHIVGAFDSVPGLEFFSRPKAGKDGSRAQRKIGRFNRVTLSGPGCMRVRRHLWE